jgi:hypothetical protein
MLPFWQIYLKRGFWILKNPIARGESTKKLVHPTPATGLCFALTIYSPAKLNKPVLDSAKNP